jgi:hypothetical protein
LVLLNGTESWYGTRVPKRHSMGPPGEVRLFLYLTTRVQRLKGQADFRLTQCATVLIHFVCLGCFLKQQQSYRPPLSECFTHNIPSPLTYLMARMKVMHSIKTWHRWHWAVFGKYLVRISVGLPVILFQSHYLLIIHDHLPIASDPAANTALLSSLRMNHSSLWSILVYVCQRKWEQFLLCLFRICVIFRHTSPNERSSTCTASHAYVGDMRQVLTQPELSVQRYWMVKMFHKSFKPNYSVNEIWNSSVTLIMHRTENFYLPQMCEQQSRMKMKYLPQYLPNAQTQATI